MRVLESVASLFASHTFLASLIWILLCPILWNIYARTEYHTHLFTKLFRGARRGCYFVFVVVFAGSTYRDWLYRVALSKAPSLWPQCDAFLAHLEPFLRYGAIALGLFGTILTLTSMWVCQNPSPVFSTFKRAFAATGHYGHLSGWSALCSDFIETTLIPPLFTSPPPPASYPSQTTSVSS